MFWHASVNPKYKNPTKAYRHDPLDHISCGTKYFDSDVSLVDYAPLYPAHSPNNKLIDKGRLTIDAGALHIR
jgi:hypothetical protein